jgi:hypothetical protein
MNVLKNVLMNWDRSITKVLVLPSRTEASVTSVIAGE